MSQRKTRVRRGLPNTGRRETIRGLGALTIAANTLPILGCSDDEPMSMGAGAGDQPLGGLSGAGGSVVDATGGSASGVDLDTGSGGATSSGGMPSMPVFDDVASCTLTPTDAAGEGPFFLHEAEVMDDANLFRQDVRDGRDGVELRLHIRMLDTSADCTTPIAGVEVYVWHTDALGFYSGFNEQNPDQTYSGAFERVPENPDRFCRGAQVTDENGVVSFTTLYPGWYNGRPIHIHFLALRPGSGPETTSYRDADYGVFTTQMYFDADFSRMILENYGPYNTRASGPGYEASLIPGSDVRPTVRMEGDIVIAALNILTDSSGSRISGAGLGGV